MNRETITHQSKPDRAETTLTQLDEERRYFSCFIPDTVGFTHQLIRFIISYKLGLSLGYDYIHTPLVSSRSSSKVYHFLGFDHQFQRCVDNCNLEKFTFCDLSIVKLCREKNINTLEQLQQALKEFSSDKKVIVRLNPSTLKVSDQEKFYLAKNLKSAIFGLPDDLHLRFHYDQLRKRDPIVLKWPRGRIKLLIHIRQGDLALVETPWKTFVTVPVGKKRISTEFNNLNEAQDNYIYVNDFFNFISQLLDFFEKNVFSLSMHSDGFKEALTRIYDNRFQLNWSEEQHNEFKASASSYDQEKFAIFDSLDNCKCQVGENDENLFDLIHSCLTSDIVITGTHQKMIPKLLSLYGDEKNPPILIVLYKEKKWIPRHFGNIAWDDSRATLIPFELGSNEWEPLIKAIKQKIENKISGK